MHPLLVEVEGRQVLITTPRVVSIGRAKDASIVCSGASVSRAHAELRPTDGGWNLVDVGSTHGTYVDGMLVTELRVVTPVTVRLGSPEDGAMLVILDASVAQTVTRMPEAPAAPAAPTGTVLRPPDVTGAWAAAPAAPPVSAAYAETMRLSTPRPEPGASDGVLPTGPDLVVEVSGEERRFRHPRRVTVGRTPENDVVVRDPGCSRFHGAFEPRGPGWLWVNASTQGTFANGRRIETMEIARPTTLRLGHPDVGAELQVTPVVGSAEAERRVVRRRRRRLLTVLGTVAVVLALVGVLVAVLAREDPAPSGPDRLTAAELDSAKVATVLLVAESRTRGGQRAVWSGSGSIISADGRILTNAHVAEPQAPGLAERYGPNDLVNPEFLQVALIEDADDSHAAPAYGARVVRSDGRVDASVIQIFATIDGDPLPERLDLPTMPLGDSDLLRAGDDVTVLGFPGISQSDRVTITRGVISTFLDDPVLGERAEIDTDARIAPGNSGGAAIDNGARIVGIPSAIFAEEASTVESGRIIPINLVRPLIEGGP